MEDLAPLDVVLEAAGQDVAELVEHVVREQVFAVFGCEKAPVRRCVGRRRIQPPQDEDEVLARLDARHVGCRPDRRDSRGR
jgi:hypothetical protein